MRLFGQTGSAPATQVIPLNDDNAGKLDVKTSTVEARMTAKADGLVSIRAQTDSGAPIVSAKIGVSSPPEEETPILEPGKYEDKRGTALCYLSKDTVYDVKASGLKKGAVKVAPLPIREIALKERNKQDAKEVMGGLTSLQDTMAYSFQATAEGKIVITVVTERGALKPRLLLYKWREPEAEPQVGMPPVPRTAHEIANPNRLGGKKKDERKIRPRATEAPLTSCSETRWRLIGSVQREAWYLLLVYGREEGMIGLFSVNIRGFEPIADEIGLGGLWFAETVGDLGATIGMALPEVSSPPPQIGRMYKDAGRDQLIGEIINGRAVNTDVAIGLREKGEEDATPLRKKGEKDPPPPPLPQALIYQQKFGGIKLSRGIAQELRGCERAVFAIPLSGLRDGSLVVTAKGRTPGKPKPIPVVKTWEEHP